MIPRSWSAANHLFNPLVASPGGCMLKIIHLLKYAFASFSTETDAWLLLTPLQKV